MTTHQNAEFVNKQRRQEKSHLHDPLPFHTLLPSSSPPRYLSHIQSPPSSPSSSYTSLQTSHSFSMTSGGYIPIESTVLVRKIQYQNTRKISRNHSPCEKPPDDLGYERSSSVGESPVSFQSVVTYIHTPHTLLPAPQTRICISSSA